MECRVHTFSVDILRLASSFAHLGDVWLHDVSDHVDRSRSVFHLPCPVLPPTLASCRLAVAKFAFNAFIIATSLRYLAIFPQFPYLGYEGIFDEIVDACQPACRAFARLWANWLFGLPNIDWDPLSAMLNLVETVVNWFQWLDLSELLPAFNLTCSGKTKMYSRSNRAAQ